MSDESSTQRLLGELASQLEPVKRVPPIGLVVAGILVLWAAHFATLLASGGFAPGFFSALTGNVAFAGAMLGLALSANGGLWGALALGAPGHDTSARIGSIVAGLGLVLALVTVGIGLGSASAAGSSANGAAWVCFYHSVALALLPGGVLVFFMFKGWVGRPLLASAVALSGSFSIGAVMVHTVCPHFDAGHILLGHLGAPLGMVALATLPLALALRRMAN